ncbi:MAG: hypothetical protein H6747_15835 [Deltaproteobacteria bacterium]|nr:hypothetical protein [Deltaproteobacteria bacterium]
MTFTIAYEVKYGVIGKLLGATAVRKQLTQVTAKYLAGVDYHLSTGEVVDQNVRLKLA